MAKKRITEGELKRVLARVSIMVVGVYLAGEPWLEFMRNWANNQFRDFLPMALQVWGYNMWSIIAGIIIIIAGLWFFELK